MTRWTYSFGGGRAEGRADMKALLGGTGANLAEMSNLGIAVPPGFTITTEACTYFSEHGDTYPDELKRQVRDALAGIEDVMGAKFGTAGQTLLLSVRSGARASRGARASGNQEAGADLGFCKGGFHFDQCWFRLIYC